jgi:hypothetical protein
MIIWSSNRWTFDLGTKDSLKALTLLILQRSTRSWSDLQTWHDLQQPSLPRYSYSVRIFDKGCVLHKLDGILVHSFANWFLTKWVWYPNFSMCLILLASPSPSEKCKLHSDFSFPLCVLWPTSFQSSCSFLIPEHCTRAITRARLSTAYEQCGAWHKSNPGQSCRRALIIATPQLLFRIKWDCQGLVLLKMYVMECWKCASKLC